MHNCLLASLSLSSPFFKCITLQSHAVRKGAGRLRNKRRLLCNYSSLLGRLLYSIHTTPIRNAQWVKNTLGRTLPTISVFLIKRGHSSQFNSSARVCEGGTGGRRSRRRRLNHIRANCADVCFVVTRSPRPDRVPPPPPLPPQQVRGGGRERLYTPWRLHEHAASRPPTVNRAATLNKNNRIRATYLEEPNRSEALCVVPAWTTDSFS